MYYWRIDRFDNDKVPDHIRKVKEDIRGSLSSFTGYVSAASAASLAMSERLHWLCLSSFTGYVSAASLAMSQQLHWLCLRHLASWTRCCVRCRPPSSPGSRHASQEAENPINGLESSKMTVRDMITHADLGEQHAPDAADIEETARRSSKQRPVTVARAQWL